MAEQEKGEEDESFWDKAKHWGGLAADAVEVAGTAGLHAAEEVPLLATAYHGTMGAIDTARMVKDQHMSDIFGKEAGGKDGTSGNLEESVKYHQKSENEGEQAQMQFLEAIPLIGTGFGIGGAVAHAINPAIDPAKTLFGGHAENRTPDGAPAPAPAGA